jgi:hypothetical protein
MTSLSALVLNTYIGTDGALCRPVEIRDAVAMSRVALAGVPLLLGQGQTTGPSRSEIDQILDAGSEGQRARAIAALRQIEGLVREINEG